MLHPIRSIVSATLAAAIALASSVSIATAQQYPYSKKTVYTDKKGTTLTVYTNKNGGYVGMSKQRKGGEARFIPAGKRSSSVSVLMARFVPDRRVTDPAPKKPISQKVVKPTKR